MPRTYVKKKAPKYGAEDLKIAKEEVESGESVYSVA